MIIHQLRCADAVTGAPGEPAAPFDVAADGAVAGVFARFRPAWQPAQALEVVRSR